MPTEEQLIGALKQADAAGDTAGAQHIADIIKQQRASAAAPAPAAPAMPQANIPAPITRDQTGLGPELKVGPVSSDQVTAAAENFGHNMLGIGDVIGAGGRMIAQARAGQPVDYDTASKQYQTQRNYLNAAHPIASTVGGVAGAVDTGVLGGAAIGAGAKAVGLSSVLSPVTSALALKEGEVVGNIGRLGLAGAAAGGAQGAAQGAGETAAAGGSPDQVAQAAAQGGEAGAALGGIGGPVVGTVAPVVAKAIAPLGAKAAAALARLMGEDPAVVQQAWSSFGAQAGRAPTMAELASMKAQSELAKAAKTSPSLGEGLVANQNASDAARVTSMQAQVSPPNPTGPTQIANATGTQGDVDYAAARAVTTPVDEDAVDFIQSKVLPNIYLKAADRQALAQQLEDGEIPGDMLGQLTKKMADTARATNSVEVHKVNEEFQDRFMNDQLDTARTNFAAGKSAEEGNALGGTVLSNKDTPDFLAKLQGQTDDQAVASPQGALTALHTAAQSPQGALKTAQDLANDTGVQQRLSAVVGPDTASALQQMGKREADAAAALSNATPGRAAAESSKDNDNIMAGMHGIAVLGAAAPWLKALHAAKIFIGRAPSEQVMRTVTKYLTDPTMTAQAIALLRKAGADNAGLRRLAIQAASMSGALTGSVAGNLSGQ